MLRLVSLALLLSYPADTQGQSRKFNPENPKASGYHLEFNDQFNDSRSVRESYSDGLSNWYRTRFFDKISASPNDIKIEKGVLKLGPTTGKTAQVQSATPAPNGPGWIGNVFYGGGYFEARLKLGADAGVLSDSWPAFWAMSVEHLALRGRDQWRGRPSGYTRFFETDFFEKNEGWGGPGDYVATAHDWSGIYKTSCPGAQFCSVTNQNHDNHMIRLPANFDWSAFHTVGQLIVPATERKRGYLQNFLDGKAVGRALAWTGRHAKDRSQPAFNIADEHGLVVILTAGKRSMDVDYVKVWQAGHP